MIRLFSLGLVIAGLACATVAGYDGYDPFGDLIGRVAVSMERVLDQEVPPTNVSLTCVNASKQYLENLRRRETWALKSKCLLLSVFLELYLKHVHSQRCIRKLYDN